jgi:hypothetical protein
MGGKLNLIQENMSLGIINNNQTPCSLLTYTSVTSS